MSRLRLKRRNLILKLDSYRKSIRDVRLIDFYKNKILLVCYSIHFNGYSLKLLNDYFCSKFFEIYNYKDNFDFVMISSRNQNYLYNYKFRKILNKNIFFFFKDFNEISLFMYRMRLLMLSPYYFYPLRFTTPFKKLNITFSLFPSYFGIAQYRYYENSFIYSIHIDLIKKIIILLFILISLRINQILKECQH